MSIVNNAPAPQGESLGEYIQKIREFRGLSKAQLARAARVAYTTIYRLEAGKTTGEKLRSEVLRRISISLQVPVDYLRSFSGKKFFIDEFPTTKVCPQCWSPGCPVDERWTMVDAKHCIFCGTQIVSQCPRCKEPLHLSAKFCPECGLSYKELGNPEYAVPIRTRIVAKAVGGQA